MPADPTEAAGPTFLWANYFFDEIKAERERRTSLEQRGLGVISLSGVLIALLLNASHNIHTSQWPAASAVLLLAALATLVTGALFGFLCALPRSYGGIENEQMRQILMKHWDEEDAIASRRIGAVHVRTIEISLELNLAKVRYLRIAIGAAALGILLSSASVTANILSGAL